MAETQAQTASASSKSSVPYPVHINRVRDAHIGPHVLHFSEHIHISLPSKPSVKFLYGTKRVALEFVQYMPSRALEIPCSSNAPGLLTLTMVKAEICFDAIRAMRVTAENEFGQLVIEICSTKFPNLAMGACAYSDDRRATNSGSGTTNPLRPTKWQTCSQSNSSLKAMGLDAFFSSKLFVFHFTAGMQLKNAMKKLKDVEPRSVSLLSAPLCICEKEIAMMAEGTTPVMVLKMSREGQECSKDVLREFLSEENHRTNFTAISYIPAPTLKSPLTSPSAESDDPHTSADSDDQAALREGASKNRRRHNPGSRDSQRKKFRLTSTDASRKVEASSTSAGQHECVNNGLQSVSTILHQVNLPAGALEDQCFVDNITKVLDVPKYLQTAIRTPCCRSSFVLRDCINSLVQCDCGDFLRFSFCEGDFRSELRWPRNHCRVCGKCGDAQDEHCVRCNRCYNSGGGCYTCPCRSGSGLDGEAHRAAALEVDARPTFPFSLASLSTQVSGLSDPFPFADLAATEPAELDFSFEAVWERAEGGDARGNGYRSLPLVSPLHSPNNFDLDALTFSTCDFSIADLDLGWAVC